MLFRSFFRANLTNRPLPQLGGTVTPEGVIHVERARFLWDTRLYERLTLTQYGQLPLSTTLNLQVMADFADIFEVRGHVRPARGRLFPASLDGDAITLAYEGLDGVLRTSVVTFSQPPVRLCEDGADFALALGRHERVSLYVEVGIDRAPAPSVGRFRSAAARARRAMRTKRKRGATVQCPRGAFQSWLERSHADLALLTTETAAGPYPFAGIPWFSTPFGRDAIITAL